MSTQRGQVNDPTELAAGQTLELATTTMQAHLPLVFRSPRYEPDDIWRVLILAAAGTPLGYRGQMRWAA